MIGWDYWQTLLAIFRSGSYAGAARVLGVDPTTVGRRLKILERRMGCALFLRNDGHLYPTNQCEVLLDHLEEAFEALRRAEQSTETLDQGPVWRLVRITAPPFIARNIYAPGMIELRDQQRMQIELIGTGSNLNLTRREADIAIRIQDHSLSLTYDKHNIVAEKIGVLKFAAYQAKSVDHGNLPWAGLTDAHIRTTGTETMHEMAGKNGLQIRVSQFDALAEVVLSGAARGLLPCFIGDNFDALRRQGDVVLKQPLWMLYHQQDRDVLHQKTTRNWLAEKTGLACD